MMPTLVALLGLAVAPVQDDDAVSRIVERVDRELQESEARLLMDLRRIIREEIRKALSKRGPARPAPEPVPAPKRPVLLGIVAGDLPPAELEQLGIKRGIKVDEVSGPAEKAGVKPGDILLKIGSDEVDESNIVGVLARHEPGDVIKITVLRDGKRKTLEVTLVER